MITLINCIAFEHDPIFLTLAVTILLIGSVVTMRLFARVRRTDKDIRALWLILAGLIGGGTIWSTHFISMLAYKTDLITGYEPIMTGVSLLIAVATTTIGFFIASFTQRSYIIELGGAVLGLGISAMHYTGMYAINLSGYMEWDATFVTMSVLLGIAFGAISTSRIARPVTRFCKYGGSLAFVLAVALMHFTSMSGVKITPIITDEVTTQLISDEVMGLSILIVMSLLFMTTFITNMIDLKSAAANSEHYKHLALHDALTGIPNRLGCEKHLSKILISNVDDTAGIAVLAIDLDRFKDTNDAHGHAAGDHLLRTVTERISSILKEGEMIGRFGGDEFFAVKKDIYRQGEATEFSNRILEAVRKPIEWKDAVLSTSASIGFSMYPKDGQEPVDLMEKADLAMYRAKTSGKDCYVAYDTNMEDANKDRVLLALELSNAIKNNEFEIYYQLQNQANTREVAGVEALLRWHHPERGTISPEVFIPIAEETGFITQLGTWVLHQACTEAMAWEMPIKVAVNVASEQISDPGFPKIVHETLLNTGLPASRLELEITESGIIADMGQALSSIRQLKELGVKIAMDDYGTGYSSLATLQNFPFDKIKIDREFIKEIESNRHSLAIVSSTVILGNSLDIPVLAEGVETEEHLKLLNEHGCQQVQGFLFGKPMPSAELQKLLKDQDNGIFEAVIVEDNEGLTLKLVS